MSSSLVDCVCDPLSVHGHPYTQWIGSVFGDCVYTPLDHLSFSLGIINICCWMVAQLPQQYQNYNLGSAKALSQGLLIAWLQGDLTNLVGCYLNHQLSTQKATAMYYVCIDTVTLCQFIYYHNRIEQVNHESTPLQSTSRAPAYDEDESTWTEEFDRDKTTAQSRTPSIFTPTEANGDSDEVARIRTLLVQRNGDYGSLQSAETQELAQDIASTSKGVRWIQIAAATVLLTVAIVTFFDFHFPSLTSRPTGSMLLAQHNLPLCSPEVYTSPFWSFIGIIVSWMSGQFYFSSRLFQLYENYKARQNGQKVEGISYTMFSITLTANFIYGVSVLLRMKKLNLDWFLKTFPFILGSMGTMIFDAVILKQGMTEKTEYHLQNIPNDPSLVTMTFQVPEESANAQL